jgi:hypothetical protein
MRFSSTVESNPLRLLIRHKRSKLLVHFQEEYLLNIVDYTPLLKLQHMQVQRKIDDVQENLQLLN